MTLAKSLPKKITIFASGSGTNAENIIRYFKKDPRVAVEMVFSNRASAKVLERSRQHNIQTRSFDRNEFYHSTAILDQLREINPDLIVLAGFLWIFPQDILHAFPDKVINIHPALLPKYGGKGMYGMKVHEAVVLQKELQTGISIHYVNEHYDEGKLIFQATCPVAPNDTADNIAAKIHQLEYRHFPEVIEKLLFPEQND